MLAILITEDKGILKDSLSKTSPRSMLKIGGIPILQHQIELLKKYKITDIHILISQARNQIINHFGNGGRFGVSISYIEENESADISECVLELADQSDEDFIIIDKAVMINMNLEKLIDFHKQKESECTLVLHPVNLSSDTNLIDLNLEKRITQCYPKPHAPELYYPNMAVAGVCLLSPAVLKSFAKGEKMCFEIKKISEIINKTKIFGYNSSEYMKNIANPEDIKEADHNYQTGYIARANFEFKQKAIFLDRDGVINKEISYISKPSEMKLYDYTASAIRKINSSDYKTIVVTNQSSIARGLITLTELKVIHNKMETDLVKEKAKIDALYFCPHHPDRSLTKEQTEYNIDCLCRKPQPGMLLDAAFDFNINLKKSFIIGDSERDILAGKNAACSSIGVMTGYGMRKSSVFPDFLFANLTEAVDFIIDEPYINIYKKISSDIIKTPCIISIGGIARSGKSTLASYLKWKIEQSEKNVMVIQLDNWLHNSNSTAIQTDILGGYQLEKAEADIQKILIGISVKLKTYPTIPDSELQEINYKYQGQEYIIIEGAVALSSLMLRDLAHIKIFLDLESEKQKKRLIQMLEWYGKDIEDFSDLYKKLRRLEIQDIEPGKKFANIII